jgi:hypothetical protein
MSKAHRGKGLREQASHGRGECPVCKRNNVKVLYEQEAGDQKFKICKTCRAAIKNGKKSLPVTVTAKAPEPAAEEKETETKTAAAEE